MIKTKLLGEEKLEAKEATNCKPKIRRLDGCENHLNHFSSINKSSELKKSCSDLSNGEGE